MVLRVAALLALAVAAAFYFEWLPYRPVSSRIYVAFPGPIDIAVGAPVEYRGLPIGRVADITLNQPDPEAPAEVLLELAIESSDVRLREADGFVFDGGGLIGEARIRIEAAAHSSPPLASGARVEGIPSLEDRVSETAGEAVRRLGDAARDAGERLGEAARTTGERILESLSGNSDAADSPDTHAADRSDAASRRETSGGDSGSSPDPPGPTR